MKRLNLLGLKFGKRIVLERLASRREGNATRSRWLVECLCGRRDEVFGYLLTRGKANQCHSCSARVAGKIIKHGHARSGAQSRTYISWYAMLQRCNNPKNIRYTEYGGRGIRVCRRWRDFRNFLLDMGLRPALKTLDRKNVNGNYIPSNCQWATNTEQRHNRKD